MHLSLVTQSDRSTARVGGFSEEMISRATIRPKDVPGLGGSRARCALRLNSLSTSSEGLAGFVLTGHARGLNDTPRETVSPLAP